MYFQYIAVKALFCLVSIWGWRFMVEYVSPIDE